MCYSIVHTLNSRWFDSTSKSYLQDEFIQEEVTAPSGRYASITYEPGVSFQWIGQGQFQESSLKSILIPKNVEIIYIKAFYKCPNLRSVTFQNGSCLREICDKAFESCPLDMIEFPASLKIIGENCFAYCRKLRHVEFQSNSQLTTIGFGAFEECKSLERFEIPALVNSIDSLAFMDCQHCIFQVHPDNKNFIIDGPCLLTYDRRRLITCITSVKELVLSKDIEVIGQDAFYNFLPLRITYEPGSNLKCIEADGWWSNHDQFISLEIPPSLEVFQDGAFTCNRNRHWDITMPEGSDHFTIVNSILLTADKTHAITGFGHPKILTIPKTVKSIGHHCFDGMSSIEQLEWEEGCSLEYIGVFAFGNTQIKKFTIPDTVVEIDDECFIYCEYTEFFISENSQLVRIGRRAFEGLWMKHFYIPQNVEVIDKHAFYMSLIQDVTFHPECRIKHFGHGVFHTSELKEITIPRSVETIGDKCFIGCKTVTLEPNSCLKEISSSSFAESVLNNMTLPEGCHITDL